MYQREITLVVVVVGTRIAADVAAALTMRANYIETGDVNLSRNDCVLTKQHGKIQVTTLHQDSLVRELRHLASELIGG